ncbi:MAG: hypothetical protein ACNA8H_06620 [Anaerolineales bacterium]
MGVQPGYKDVPAEASEQKALIETLVGTVHIFLGEMASDISRGC